MLIYQLVITAIVVAIFTVAVVNLLTLRRFRDFQPRAGEARPLVSILVPARNEARNIERCVRSLLAQDYPNFELIVLDDLSEDQTGAIVEQIAAKAQPQAGSPQGSGGTEKLRLLRGGPLLAGWLGKNNACRQLAAAARGEYLLFTDADTYHAPGSLTSAMAAAVQQRADLLSIFPRQEVVSFGERLVLPLLHFTVFAFLPMLAVYSQRLRYGSLGVGNGQFLLFRRLAYEAIGGHAAVKGRILEDVLFGRLIKSKGYRLFMPDGTDAVSCRMYRSTTETVRGLGKTMYAFFNYSLPFALFVLNLHFDLFVAPWGFLAWGLLHPTYDALAWIVLPAVQIALMLAVRFAFSRRFRSPLLDALLLPLSFLGYIGISLYAVWLRYAKGGVSWKGRNYSRPD